MVQNLSLNATIPWWLVWKAFPAEVLAQLRLVVGTVLGPTLAAFGLAPLLTILLLQGWTFTFLKRKFWGGSKLTPETLSDSSQKLGAQYPGPTNMVAPKSVALLTLLLQGWTVDMTLSWHTNYDSLSHILVDIFQRLKHQLLSGHSFALHIKY